MSLLDSGISCRAVVLRNLIHASDSLKTANREINLWFNSNELHSYEKELDSNIDSEARYNADDVANISKNKFAIIDSDSSNIVSELLYLVSGRYQICRRN